MKHLAIAFLYVCAASQALAQETPLDTRRKQLLQELDQTPVQPGDPQYPMPNLTLKYGFGENDYHEKILAVFGLIDMGVEPSSRISEANKLLRYVMLGRNPAPTQTSLIGQYASAWSHRSRSLGIRQWMLYKGWLEPDIKQEFLKRLNWLCVGPYNQSSENIKCSNNNATFLAHEILGKTNLATYQENRQWWIGFLKNFGKDGAGEWGTTYNGWTVSAILNLAEFAQDPTVKKLATMALDYWMARTSGFQIAGHFASGAVRRYGHWLFASNPPQSHIAKVNFFGGAEYWVEWGVTNFKPLTAVQSLYVNAGPGDSRITETKWRHQSHRGAKFALSTQLNFVPDYYQSTHDIVSCFAQSAKGPQNHVIPYGLPFGADTKWRSTVERGFGYKNVGFVNTGGFCRRTWTGGQQHNIPIRLFYFKDFSVQISGNWAFLTDGVIYVAWAPTIGNPIVDPDSSQLSNPTKTGSWLRSDAVPTDAGEACVLEVGDAASFGSYENFKNNILARNPNPTWNNNQVVYHAKDGATIVFALGYGSVNGQVWDPDAHPRAQMAGVSGFSISGGITFNFDAVATTGTLTRVSANKTFGQTGPLPLAIATPATLPGGNQGMVYSKTLAATGGTPPYTTWVKIWGTIPPGLALNGATISGTPSAQGTYSFRIRVYDSAGAMTSRLFSLTIGPPIPLAITTPATLPNAKKGVAYSLTLSATGGSGVYTNWVKIWGTYPPGISLNGNKIVGTPTAVGTWSFRIRVWDSNGSFTSRLFSLKVNP